MDSCTYILLGYGVSNIQIKKHISSNTRVVNKKRHTKKIRVPQIRVTLNGVRTDLSPIGSRSGPVHPHTKEKYESN